MLLPASYLDDILCEVIPDEAVRLQFRPTTFDGALIEFQHISTAGSIYVDPNTLNCFRRRPNGKYFHIQRDSIPTLDFRAQARPPTAPSRLGSSRTRSAAKIYDRQRDTYVRTLLKYKGNRCAICGLRMLLTKPHPGSRKEHLYITVDHIQPRANGGSTADIKNMQLAHKFCNLERGAGEITPELRDICKKRILKLIADCTDWKETV